VNKDDKSAVKSKITIKVKFKMFIQMGKKLFYSVCPILRKHKWKIDFVWMTLLKINAHKTECFLNQISHSEE
jgi:hypothetical protein